MSNYYEINSPHVISESLGGETVIINLQTGTYHNLNGNSSRVWQALTRPVDLDTLVDAVRCAPPVQERPDLQRALAFFLESLLAQELVRIAIKPEQVESLDVIDLSSLELICESYTDMQDLLGLDPIHEVDPQAGWPNKIQTPPA
ncbi:MAG: hypothetical protein B7Y05_05185 [Polynucleobacter sp. 24-46-87]|jgi:hypothetical protein|nr:MAG: hypothetical protein B7Y55_00405 [Polynucleobacter sp. 35-46-207]OZA15128.1 MAG: hypothetical protein B7Y05_05185 [Polynucleobacter sp. 24-46-87]OZA41754.1 MAG: hypothetical protein B7X83_01390 [Polynucleobacter sp. 17-46-58]HQT21200.1 PqqD family protein [Polynucleobacter sp.]HQT42010.1 PqqD family protein [Polynucleobacter sp.]